MTCEPIPSFAAPFARLLMHKGRNGYQMSGKGRFVSLMLKRPKGAKKAKPAKKAPVKQKRGNSDEEDEDAADDIDDVSLPLTASE
jgi:hypothetical protein